MAMRSRQVLIAACVVPLALAASLAAGADYLGELPLTGKYYLYSGEPGDAAAPTAKDAKIAFEITGGAARQMFDRLGRKAEIRECAPEGEHIRMRGDLNCSKDATNKYLCQFGLDLRSGKSTSSTTC